MILCIRILKSWPNYLYLLLSEYCKCIRQGISLILSYLFSIQQVHNTVLVFHNTQLDLLWGVLLHRKVSPVLSPWMQILWKPRLLVFHFSLLKEQNCLFRLAGDTCTALVQYQQDPRKSSLSSILPCSDLLSAKPVLLDAKKGIHDFVNQVWIFQVFFSSRLLFCAYISQ